MREIEGRDWAPVVVSDVVEDDGGSARTCDAKYDTGWIVGNVKRRLDVEGALGVWRVH